MIGFRRRNAEAEGGIDADGRPQHKATACIDRLPGCARLRCLADRRRGLAGVRAQHLGEVGEHRDRLIDFLAQQNIALEFNERIAPALGVSYGGKIALLPGQSKAEEFVTLVHETAHELLHRAERRTFTTATVRETEAEAVAFIVGQAIGLEMGNASSDYIQMYAGNATLLAESLEVVQRTAAVILGAITAEESAPQDSTNFSPQTHEAIAEVA